MQRGLEWHDSTLEAMDWAEGCLELKMDAYIHESAGVPGVDPGTGWYDRGELLWAVKERPDAPPLPQVIADDTMRRADGSQLFMLCLPIEAVEMLELTLTFSDGSTWCIQGRPLEWRGSGERSAQEQFPGSR